MGKERMVVRYSEAFKRKVVEEIESGELGSINEASRRYGIRGTRTVAGWIRRLGRNHLLAKVVRVEMADEKKEIDRLRKRVRELEHALAQTRMRELLNEAFFEIVCEDHGIKDIDAMKKKLDAEVSRRRGAEGERAAE